MASILEQQKALIGQKLEQRKDVIGSSANREDFVGLVDGAHSSLLGSQKTRPKTKYANGVNYDKINGRTNFKSKNL